MIIRIYYSQSVINQFGKKLQDCVRSNEHFSLKMHPQHKGNNFIVHISSISVNNNKQPLSPNETKKKSSRHYIGLLFAILSSLTFSLGTLLVKLLNAYHPFILGVWRFQGILWPSLILLLYCWWWKNIPVLEPLYGAQWAKTTFLLCCRWFFSTTAILLQYFSLRYIPVADSLVVTFSTPVFVTLVAHKVLGERCGLIPVFCAIITLVGVGVISRPSILTGETQLFDEDSLVGITFALGSMICTGIAFVLMRYLRTIHFSVMMMLFGVWGTFECCLLVGLLGETIVWLPDGRKDTIIAVGLASLSFISQGALVLALKFEQASLVAIFRTADVLFGFAWQSLLLGIIPDMNSIVGGVIVVSGVLLLGFRKWLSGLSPEHAARNIFCLILK